jgi:hypothetical protein
MTSHMFKRISLGSTNPSLFTRAAFNAAGAMFTFSDALSELSDALLPGQHGTISPFRELLAYILSPLLLVNETYRQTGELKAILSHAQTPESQKEVASSQGTFKLPDGSFGVIGMAAAVALLPTAAANSEICSQPYTPTPYSGALSSLVNSMTNPLLFLTHRLTQNPSPRMYFTQSEANEFCQLLDKESQHISNEECLSGLSNATTPAQALHLLQKIQAEHPNELRGALDNLWGINLSLLSGVFTRNDGSTYSVTECVLSFLGNLASAVFPSQVFGINPDGNQAQSSGQDGVSNAFFEKGIPTLVSIVGFSALLLVLYAAKKLYDSKVTQHTPVFPFNVNQDPPSLIPGNLDPVRRTIVQNAALAQNEVHDIQLPGFVPDTNDDRPGLLEIINPHEIRLNLENPVQADHAVRMSIEDFERMKELVEDLQSTLSTPVVRQQQSGEDTGRARLQRAMDYLDLIQKEQQRFSQMDQAWQLLFKAHSRRTSVVITLTHNRDHTLSEPNLSRPSRAEPSYRKYLFQDETRVAPGSTYTIRNFDDHRRLSEELKAFSETIYNRFLASAPNLPQPLAPAPADISEKLQELETILNRVSPRTDNESVTLSWDGVVFRTNSSSSPVWV